MGDFILSTLDNASNPLTLHPSFDFKKRKRIQRGASRGQEGEHHTWDRPGYLAYSVPLIHVDSSDKSRIAEWWRNHDLLRFTLNTSEDISTVLCKIVNRDEPFQAFVEPYPNLFQGVLMLEAIDETGLRYLPFILDDAFLGRLDQTYNRLL